MSVTSVTLYYNSAAATNGLLLFTGNTYQMVAKDQSGNVLSNASGTWSSTDATNFPIDSSGLISPAAGIGGGTVSFTHTATGLVGTAAVSVLKTPGAVYKQDWGVDYVNTTAFMANIKSTLSVDSSYNSYTPSNTTGTALYIDGADVNHITIDSTTNRLFMGTNVFLQGIPTTGGSGELLVSMSGFTRAWGLMVHRFDPNFTMVGTGGGNASYKITPWFVFSPGGRAGPLMINGSNTSGSGGGPGGQLATDCYLQSGSIVGGGSEYTQGTLTSEFTAGEYWVEIVLYENRSGNIMSSRLGHFKLGDVPSLTYGTANEGPMSTGWSVPSAIEFEMMGANYNQDPPSSNLFVAIAGWQIVNGDTYGDPYGVLGDTSTPTLTGITGGTVTQGDSSDTITLTGTNFTVNCWPVFSNSGIRVQSITINSSTQMTVVVSVDATASTGAGTVKVYNGSSQNQSGTQTVTVNASSGISIRQHNTGTNSCSMTSTLSGSTIIVPIGMLAGVTVSSISDNAGNTYTQCTSAYVNGATGAGAALDIWYCQNATAGCTSISVTTSNGSSAGVFGVEVTGLLTSGVFETAGHHFTTTSSTTITGGSVTTAHAKDFIIGIGVNPASYNTITGMASGNPFTIGDIVSGALATATLVTSSTGTYTPAWTQSSAGAQLGTTAAFKG